jgi:hypothetical protein
LRWARGKCTAAEGAAAGGREHTGEFLLHTRRDAASEREHRGGVQRPMFTSAQA